MKQMEVLKIISDIKLTRRQELKTANLGITELLNYVQSLKGLYKKRIYDLNRYHNRLGKLDSKQQGTYSSMFKKLTNPLNQHSPMKGSQIKWYGVEIECLFPCDSETCSSCDGDGCSNCDDNGYIKNTVRVENELRYQIQEVLQLKRISIKSDGSIDEEGHEWTGVEFNVLCSNDDDFHNLKELCAYLKRAGAKVNKSCGMHVHLDQRNVPVDVVRLRHRNLDRATHALSQIMPESRKNNRYCSLNNRKNERYSAINYTALKKYQTLEVRLHSSTIEYTKIKNWIELLDLVQDAPARVIKSDITDLEELFTVLDVPEKLIEYCLMRRDKFLKKDAIQEFDIESNVSIAA